jgi:hypothetical protein
MNVSSNTNSMQKFLYGRNQNTNAIGFFQFIERQAVMVHNVSFCAV